MLYAVLKNTVATLGRIWFRLSAVGADQVRGKGVCSGGDHLSVLDPALIGSVMPRELDYMAKTELFGIPGFGADPAPQRASRRPHRIGLRSAATRARLLGDGRALLVFPEGTRGIEGSSSRPGQARAC